MAPETVEIDRHGFANILSVFKTKKTPAAQENEVSSTIYIDEEITSEDRWWEEDDRLRELPLTVALQQDLDDLLKNNLTGIRLTHFPELTLRIAEAITIASREEPGGMHACRVYVQIIGAPRIVPDTPDRSLPGALTLGPLDLTDSYHVPTFEIYVYLFPSNTWLSKIQSLFTSISTNEKKKTTKRIQLVRDFAMHKRKLFRSKRNSIELIRRSSFQS